ncbi:MAG: hypothetical protein J7L47_06235 [Candidatus Odinarchaeota archaeon]|nr:hypothetical protein [Candidatus Odinarchaeota archaeon]
MTIWDILAAVFSLPSYVLMLIVLWIIGMIAGLKPSRAFRCGLLYAIGLWGLLTISNLLGSNFAPAVVNMSQKWAVGKYIVDTPGVWTVIFATLWPALSIPIQLGVNFILLYIGFTKTFNIDVFNFQFYYFLAVYAYVLSGGNWIYSIIVYIVTEIIILKIADFTAPAIQKHFDLPENVSFTQFASACCAVVGATLGKLFMKIPKLKDIKADPRSLRERFGLFGDPVVIGLIVALVISGIGLWPDWISILSTSVIVAACIYILPKMVAILIEGLVGICNAVRDKVSKSKRFKGIYIGIDSYITAGYEDVISAVVLTMVFTEIACALIPTIHALPVTGLPFFIGDTNFILPYVGGNILIAAIVATIWEIIGAHFASWVAPIYTQGMAMYGGAVEPGVLYTWVVCPGWHIALWIWNLIWQSITHLFGA